MKTLSNLKINNIKIKDRYIKIPECRFKLPEKYEKYDYYNVFLHLIANNVEVSSIDEKNGIAVLSLENFIRSNFKEFNKIFHLDCNYIGDEYIKIVVDMINGNGNKEDYYEICKAEAEWRLDNTIKISAYLTEKQSKRIPEEAKKLIKPCLLEDVIRMSAFLVANSNVKPNEKEIKEDIKQTLIRIKTENNLTISEEQTQELIDICYPFVEHDAENWIEKDEIEEESEEEI